MKLFNYKITDYIMGVLLAVCALYGYESYDLYKRKISPASDWLTVDRVIIPDSPINTDVNIIVDRKIKKQFRLNLDCILENY